MTLETVLGTKNINDLIDDTPVSNPSNPNLTDAKIEEVLIYLKWQNLCTNTEDNEEYIGKSDTYICKKVNITQTQLNLVKAAREAKIQELTNPNE